MKQNVTDRSVLQRKGYLAPSGILIHIERRDLLCNSIETRDDTQDYEVDPYDDIQF